MFKTISDVKRANKELGHHFFDKDSMKFFNSRVESTLYKSQCFVTSERAPNSNTKKYTIRLVNADGSISTYGKFMQYNTLECAKDDAKLPFI